MLAPVEIILQHKVEPLAAGAIEDHVQVFRRQFAHRRIQAKAVMPGNSLQELVVITTYLNTLNSPGCNRFAAVGDDQLRVDFLFIAQTGAFRAGPVGAVEGKEAR